MNEFLDLQIALFFDAYERCQGIQPVDPFSPVETHRFNELATKRNNANNLSVAELEEFTRLTEKGLRIIEAPPSHLLRQAATPVEDEQSRRREPNVPARDRVSLPPSTVPPAPDAFTYRNPNLLAESRMQDPRAAAERQVTPTGFLEDDRWIEVPGKSSSRPGVSSLQKIHYLPQSQRRDMGYDEDKIITVSGTKYLPVFLAARRAQSSDRTVRRWAEKSVSFNGNVVQSYTSPTTGELFINEKSVERLETRFIKWPSKEPAGRVVLGETKEHNGFFSLAQAAKIVGISSSALWKWASRGEVPSLSRHLDVVKCPISDQLYIREGDARHLAEVRTSVGLKHSSFKPGVKKLSGKRRRSKAARD